MKRATKTRISRHGNGRNGNGNSPHSGGIIADTKASVFNHEVYKKHFRVAVFGSARIQKGDPVYRQVYRLAKKIGEHGHDIITGGGPGLMEAANAGHETGDQKKKADSIGLTIMIAAEEKPNRHLELKKHFDKFSNRLDHFMALSNVVVVMPGGIGTCLELFYTWQLTQVKHICPIPIIVVGTAWKKLIAWVKRYPLKHHLMSVNDFDNIHVARNEKEAFELIEEAYAQYKALGNDACLNLTKYKVI